MRLELKELLEKLGVGHPLAPYETHPWLVYSEEKGLTCSAEVRMNPSGQDLEAEIQFLYDEKDEDEEGEQGGSGGEGESQSRPASGREQILWLRAELVSEDKWTLKLLRIKEKDYVNEFYDWETKGCEFFLSCVEALQMDEIPDIELLVEEKMKDDSFWGGMGSGKIGRKAPKIKPASLLGMKKP